MENDNGFKFSRRAFLGGLGVLGGAAVARAQEKMEMRIAPAAQYKPPYPRQEYITPPGSQSHSRFQRLCTGCQLCVTACPNGVLVSASSPAGQIAQPVLTYERGFCRPGCHRCSQVCPTGAISSLSRGAKSSIQIGHAVFDMKACVAVTDGVSCGLCARRCPAGAISMVKTTVKVRIVQIPAIDEARCIGCGACEHYCPAKPQSAIHVEGHQVHKEI